MSYTYWERRLGTGLPAGYSDVDEPMTLANLLGNCALLEKSFNISKSDKTLKAFMGQVHEFEEKAGDLNDWATALAIPAALLNPDASGADDIAAAAEGEGRQYSR